MKKLFKALLAVSLTCSFAIPSTVASAAATKDANQVISIQNNSLIYTLQQNDFKYYEVESKGSLAIPLTYDEKESNVPDKRAYTVNPVFEQIINRNTISITLSNVVLGGESNNFNNLISSSKFVKSISLSSIGTNKIKIDIEFNDKANVKVNTVKRRYSTLSDEKLQFRTYVNLVFEEKGSSPSKTIVIDPGHGGADRGTYCNFTYEKDLNLDISKRIEKGLKEKGYQVYITRNDDRALFLLDRPDPANLLNADLFLSVHNNSVPLDLNMHGVNILRGTTVLYNSTAPKPARDFANLLMKEVSNSLGTNTSPLQDRGGLAVLNSTWIPAVLLEATFQSDDSDMKMMNHRIARQKIANASIQAIEKYFSNK